MLKVSKNLEDFASKFELSFYRLIAICVRPKLHSLGSVPPFRQLLSQKGRSICLEEKFCLKIETRREAKIGVCRPGEAINATVLASSIGIDRTVKADVGALVI